MRGVPLQLRRDFAARRLRPRAKPCGQRGFDAHAVRAAVGSARLLYGYIRRRRSCSSAWISRASTWWQSCWGAIGHRGFGEVEGHAHDAEHAHEASASNSNYLTFFLHQDFLFCRVSLCWPAGRARARRRPSLPSRARGRGSVAPLGGAMLPLLLVLPLQWTASSRAVWSARPLRPLPTSPMLAAVLSSDDHDEEAGPPSATFLRTPAQRVLVNVERLGIEGQMLGLALEEDGLALLAEAKLDSELSLTLCDGPFIRELNTQWRGIDKETDVLSFPMDDDVILGDVVICVDVAQRQAWERDYELRDEARVLMVRNTNFTTLVNVGLAPISLTTHMIPHHWQRACGSDYSDCMHDTTHLVRRMEL